ncbi:MULTISPECIES: helix-turn-helix domain-containing protein [unclassified Streptomyces]|uniref:helix-turn-helix domain-containing protein n=1 Tax=unclassified Streptomyces TaxID=2593676 RepID=UPI002E0E4611|nr:MULTISPECIES: helix-turn-helix domain-containing protein [unclassified Streptomyces]WSR22845.1 helix-turn-helix domain-containing protein [Streptomyces sp. NBC_01205]
MPGGRLTNEDRQQIAAGLAEGLGYTEIGQRLGRPASTVMREVTRNGGPDGYRADRAQEATRERARRPKQAQPAAAPPVSDSGHGRDPRAVQDFTEFLTALLGQQGLPRMAARVLVRLYVTDSGTLTAAELAQQLRVSPASVSHAVTFLEEQGMIRRERAVGGRRERYVVDDEIWFRSTLTAVRTNDALMAASQRGAEILGVTTPAGARFESSGAFLLVVSESLRQGLEQWRRMSERPEGGT